MFDVIGMVYRFEFESEPLGGIHASYPETHMVKLIDNGNAADLVLNLLGVIGRLYHVGIGEWCPPDPIFPPRQVCTAKYPT